MSVCLFSDGISTSANHACIYMRVGLEKKEKFVYYMLHSH